MPKSRNDPLYHRLKQTEIEQALLLDEEVDVALVQDVITIGYANDLTDSDAEQIGRDPFLIAYALAQPADRCVVTVEGPKPSKKRQNRHIPDVCGGLGVRCMDHSLVTARSDFTPVGTLSRKTGVSHRMSVSLQR